MLNYKKPKKGRLIFSVTAAVTIFILAISASAAMIHPIETYAENTALEVMYKQILRLPVQNSLVLSRTIQCLAILYLLMVNLMILSLLRIIVQSRTTSARRMKK